MNLLLEKVADTEKLSYALCLTTAKSSKLITTSGGVVSTTSNGAFNAEYLRDQCKYFALPSLIALAQKGFSCVKPYEEFYNYYRAAVAHCNTALPVGVNYATKRTIAANGAELSKILLQGLLPLLMQTTKAGG